MLPTDRDPYRYLARRSLAAVPRVGRTDTPQDAARRKCHHGPCTLCRYSGNGASPGPALPASAHGVRYRNAGTPNGTRVVGVDR